VAKGNRSKVPVRTAHRSGRWLGAIDVILSIVLASAVGALAQNSAHVFGNPDIWQWPPSRTYHVENYKLKMQYVSDQGTCGDHQDASAQARFAMSSWLLCLSKHA
jgi:hypothetical protein